MGTPEYFFGPKLNSPKMNCQVCNGDLLQDTPKWTNGYHCQDETTPPAYPTPAEGCSFQGWTCEGYESQGWCKDGTINFGAGSDFNYPEKNCCACGGGRSADEAFPAKPSQAANQSGQVISLRGSVVAMTNSGTDASAVGVASELHELPKLSVNVVKPVAYISSELTSGVCMDTHYWTNGYDCAGNGQSADIGCNASGWTCDGYGLQGWCADGAPTPNTPEYFFGPKLNSPKMNCRVCNGDLLQDTPKWTNGYHCQDETTPPAYPTPAEGCSFQGWTCEGYESQGWCKNGTINFGASSDFNYPEKTCCACGGGHTV